MINNQELPIGFTIELSRQIEAMNQYANMPKEEQERIADGARGVNSRNEMREYVSNIFKK